MVDAPRKPKPVAVVLDDGSQVPYPEHRQAMYSIRAWPKEEPQFTTSGAIDAAAKRAADHAALDATKNIYLAASGTLTQFNAILAGIGGAGIAAVAGPARIAMCAALALHISAAFLLC